MAGNSPTARPIFSQGNGRSRDTNEYAGLENFVGAGGAANANAENTKASTRGISDNLFNQSIVEQAQSRKPAFNTATFRVPNEATASGFVSFNPGPGSYSTRINSIGS